LNRRKKTKSAPNRLIPRKLTENLELYMIHATCTTYVSSEKEAALGLPQLGVRLLADSNS